MDYGVTNQEQKMSGDRGDRMVAYTMVGCLAVLAYLVFIGAI